MDGYVGLDISNSEHNKAWFRGNNRRANQSSRIHQGSGGVLVLSIDIMCYISLCRISTCRFHGTKHRIRPPKQLSPVVTRIHLLYCLPRNPSLFRRRPKLLAGRHGLLDGLGRVDSCILQAPLNDAGRGQFLGIAVNEGRCAGRANDSCCGSGGDDWIG